MRLFVLLRYEKSNGKVIVIQCICYIMIVSEYSTGITQMAEILTINVSKETSEIGTLLQKVDNMKRLNSR